MKNSMKALVAIIFCASSLTSALCHAATMRCDHGIISEGDVSFDVIQKCGDPDSRDVTNPIVGSNGRTPENSVPIENWVYGPKNGVFRYLRFVDGKLVKINTKPL